MKVGLVELVPNETIVHVTEPRVMTATFVSEVSPTHVRVRWAHNGGIYTIRLDDLEVGLKENVLARRKKGKR